MPLTAEDHRLVLETLDAYAERYDAKDVDGVSSLFVRDSEVVLFGTGADEVWVGYHQVREQFARNFAEAEAVHFEWTWRRISGTKGSAWAATTANVHVTVDGVMHTISIRFSVVPGRRDGEWKWVHRHARLQPVGRAPASRIQSLTVTLALQPDS